MPPATTYVPFAANFVAKLIRSSPTLESCIPIFVNLHTVFVKLHIAIANLHTHCYESCIPNVVKLHTRCCRVTYCSCLHAVAKLLIVVQSCIPVAMKLPIVVDKLHTRRYKVLYCFL